MVFAMSRTLSTLIFMPLILSLIFFPLFYSFSSRFMPFSRFRASFFALQIQFFDFICIATKTDCLQIMDFAAFLRDNNNANAT
jgi:hypothetical protein